MICILTGYSCSCPPFECVCPAGSTTTHSGCGLSVSGYAPEDWYPQTEHYYPDPSIPPPYEIPPLGGELFPTEESFEAPTLLDLGSGLIRSLKEEWQGDNREPVLHSQEWYPQDPFSDLEALTGESSQESSNDYAMFQQHEYYYHQNTVSH